MPFSKVHTKNMDLSNFVIGSICYMARDLILYLIATWPFLDLFSQDKKLISLKTVVISKILVKFKGVNFSFFIFSRLFMMTFSFLHIFNFNIFLLTKALRTRCSIDVQVGYCDFTNTLCDVRATYVIYLRRNDS